MATHFALSPIPMLGRCNAMTASGHQCNRRPTSNASIPLCRQHKRIYMQSLQNSEPEPEPELPIPPSHESIKRDKIDDLNNSIYWKSAGNSAISYDDSNEVINKKIDKVIERLSCRMLRPASVNTDDFLTLSSLSDFPESEIMISYVDRDNKVWTFLLDSIAKLFDMNSFINPYTQLQFDSGFLRTIGTIRKCNELRNYITNKQSESNEEVRSVLHTCIELFHLIDELDHITKIEWFMSLNIIQIITFAKMLKDIWDYRANLSDSMRMNHTKNGKFFNKPELAIHMLYGYPREELSLLILDECKRLVTEGRTRSDKSLGALWILTALTVVNLDAKKCLPWLYESLV